MAEPIKLILRCAEYCGSDAPTVRDFVSQVGDVMDLLVSRNKVIAKDGKQAVEWRITDMVKNSPLAIQVTPSSKNEENVEKTDGTVEYRFRMCSQVLGLVEQKN